MIYADSSWNKEVSNGTFAFSIEDSKVLEMIMTCNLKNDLILIGIHQVEIPSIDIFNPQISRFLSIIMLKSCSSINMINQNKASASLKLLFDPALLILSFWSKFGLKCILIEVQSVHAHKSQISG